LFLNLRKNQTLAELICKCLKNNITGVKQGFLGEQALFLRDFLCCCPSYGRFFRRSFLLCLFFAVKRSFWYKICL